MNTLKGLLTLISEWKNVNSRSKNVGVELLGSILAIFIANSVGNPNIVMNDVRDMVKHQTGLDLSDVLQGNNDPLIADKMKELS